MMKKVFGGTPSSTAAILTMRDPSSKAAKFAVELLEGNEEVFGRKAYAKAVAYAKKKSKPEPLLMMPK